MNFQSGTCYTEDECADRKGTASGSCAEGYGVCCVCTYHFKKAKKSQNNLKIHS